LRHRRHAFHLRLSGENISDRITQGGYANNIVVKERFAIPLPKTIRLQDAAPLLCAGITTYSPLIKALIKEGDKVGVAGIGGLGHLAIKLAVAKGAEVYAFTTSASKVNDIRRFGAKELVVAEFGDESKSRAVQHFTHRRGIPQTQEVIEYCAENKSFPRDPVDQSQRSERHVGQGHQQRSALSLRD
jgi:D-arabinose 1-dehydrogenase-like Zn-dependent alcohol dehydrogenase